MVMFHNLHNNFGNWCIFPENELIYQGKWLKPQIVSGAEIINNHTNKQHFVCYSLLSPRILELFTSQCLTHVLRLPCKISRISNIRSCLLLRFGGNNFQHHRRAASGKYEHEHAATNYNDCLACAPPEIEHEGATVNGRFERRIATSRTCANNVDNCVL